MKGLTEYITEWISSGRKNNEVDYKVVNKDMNKDDFTEYLRLHGFEMTGKSVFDRRKDQYMFLFNGNVKIHKSGYAYDYVAIFDAWSRTLSYILERGTTSIGFDEFMAEIEKP